MIMQMLLQPSQPGLRPVEKAVQTVFGWFGKPTGRKRVSPGAIIRDYGSWFPPKEHTKNQPT